MDLSKVIIGYVILIPAVYIILYSVYDTWKEVGRGLKKKRKNKND